MQLYETPVGLDSIEQIRDYIDVLNGKILPTLGERSKFPICDGFFGGRNHYYLKSLGLDPSNWCLTYSRVVWHLSEPGESSSIGDVIPVERTLEGLIQQRIGIGNIVGLYKARTGKPVNDPEREAQILYEVGKQGLQYGLPRATTAQVFQFLMDKNKEIQREVIRTVLHQAQPDTLD